MLLGAAEKEAERLPQASARRGGRLLEETDAAFLRAYERGHGLWEAVAIALGEEELPQTEP